MILSLSDELTRTKNETGSNLLDLLLFDEEVQCICQVLSDMDALFWRLLSNENNLLIIIIYFIIIWNHGPNDEPC